MEVAQFYFIFTGHYWKQLLNSVEKACKKAVLISNDDRSIITVYNLDKMN